MGEGFNEVGVDANITRKHENAWFAPRDRQGRDQRYVIDVFAVMFLLQGDAFGEGCVARQDRGQVREDLDDAQSA